MDVFFPAAGIKVHIAGIGVGMGPWVLKLIQTPESCLDEAVLYCPHGRPVIYEFTKQKLDKMFDRL